MKAMMSSGKTRKAPESFEECEKLRDVFFVKNIGDEQTIAWAEAFLLKNPDALNERPVTPMHDAALSGRPALMDWVFEKRPDLLNASFLGIRTPLHMACSMKIVDGVSYLLKLGADPNAGASAEGSRSSVIATPMEQAIESQWLAGVELLVAAGAQLNKANVAGRLPFVRAVIKELPEGSFKISRRLVELGADPNGLNPARLSGDAGDPSAGQGALHVACAKDISGLAQKTRELLDMGCDPNVLDSSGRSPISHALRRSCGNEQVAALLLARGADPWIQDRHGYSPAKLSVDQDLSQSEEVAAVIRAWVEAKELCDSLYNPAAPKRAMSL